MPKNVQVGDKVIEFPDGMSDDQISAAIRAQMAPPSPSPADLAKQALASNPKTAGMTVSTPKVPAPPQNVADENDFGGRVMTHVVSNVAQMGQNVIAPRPMGPMMQNWQNAKASDILPIQAIKDKDYASAAGDVITNGLLAAAAGKAGKAATGSAVPDYTPPEAAGTTANTVTPAEATARAITKAVNPPAQEWQGHIKAVAQEAGNIVDFAKKTGNPLNSQLDWAKAARGAAQERNAFFTDEVLKPVADKPIDVSGNGQNVKTLGQIYDRIGTINDQLRSAYKARTQGQVMTSLANEAELVAEKEKLSSALDNTLAQAHNVAPGDITSLRQSVGRLFSIADQTEGAVNQRASSAGKAEEGRRDIPVTSAAVIEGLAKKVLGGPEGIANRGLRKALATSQIQPSDLPKITPGMTMAEVEAAMKARLAARQAAKSRLTPSSE